MVWNEEIERIWIAKSGKSHSVAYYPDVWKLRERHVRQTQRLLCACPHLAQV